VIDGFVDEIEEQSSDMGPGIVVVCSDRVTAVDGEIGSPRLVFVVVTCTIGWQLFILDSSQRDPIALSAFLDTYATRILTEPLSGA
jgi:hypothetical protein